MLFVLSMCGYPIDGLTQSTVMAAQEVMRDNKFVVAGCTAMTVIVVLLVWTCAALDGRRNRGLQEHDHFARAHSRRSFLQGPRRNIAAVNSGGR